MVLASSFVLSACDFKKSDPINLAVRANPEPTSQGRPEDQLITFSHLQKTAFVSCKGCHSNPEKTVLRTHAEYLSKLDDVVLAIHEERMPPFKKKPEYKPLTNCEKAMLEKWVELGAPETTEVKVYDLAVCNPTEPPPVVVEPPPVEPPPINEDELISFATLQKTALVSCKDCHSKTSNPTKKPLLTTAEHYKARISDVVNEINNETMPPTEEGYLLLTKCEKAMLTKWIELGAPEISEFKITDLEACRPAKPPPVVVEPQPEEQLVTFDYLVKTAFVSCAECHTKTKNPNKKPLLTNLDEYKARIADVVMAVNANDMPYTDNGARLLNACEKAMMNKWVDAGAPAASTVKVSDIPECKNAPPPPAESEKPLLDLSLNNLLTEN